jgi:hypothetical protein
MRAHYFTLRIHNSTVHWVGGPLKQDHMGTAWLTDHNGKPIWKVAEESITEITGEALVKLLEAK